LENDCVIVGDNQVFILQLSRANLPRELAPTPQFASSLSSLITYLSYKLHRFERRKFMHIIEESIVNLEIAACN